jgi:phospholipid/cholesterol/gamma-HCH transport system permease protein
MLKNMFAKPDNRRVYRKQFFEQAKFIGFDSLILISIISLFLGMVMTLQVAYMLSNPIVPRSVVATVVRDTMLLEISPTGVGAILAGVIGFKVTSEIGYMRLYEQIDALEMMGVQSLNYIVQPRIMATMLTVPCLIIISLTLSMFGGYAVALFSTSVPRDYYITGLTTNFKPFEVVVAAVKSVTFAFVISSVACYLGYYFKGSSYDLSRTAVKSVVVNCLVILTLDYFISSLML